MKRDALRGRLAKTGPSGDHPVGDKVGNNCAAAARACYHPDIAGAPRECYTDAEVD